MNWQLLMEGLLELVKGLYANDEDTRDTWDEIET